jgi:DNA-binding LytR/AlgR family response regulator
VDDEPIARKIVEKYCGCLPDLEVKASCGSALEAKSIMQNGDVDIIFLDINMPVLDGISFIKTLKHPPQIIFTTAYREYALDAFDLAACDYLLKPFSLERFIIAVDKAMEKIRPAPDSNVVVASEPVEKYNDFSFIRAEGKVHRIKYADILYAEAKGNYTSIVIDQLRLLPAMTFTAVETLLPQHLFSRIHRSFIVNKSRITHIEGNRVYIGDIELPIGSNYKDDFLKRLGI